VIVIVFGVLGAGKTTIGKLLAQELNWRFYEADDFHSQANIDKLRRGIPLTDKDRWPWLENLRELLQRCVEAGENMVLACSALKRAYRERLRVSGAAQREKYLKTAWGKRYIKIVCDVISRGKDEALVVRETRKFLLDDERAYA
jgi:gluconokinase